MSCAVTRQFGAICGELLELILQRVQCRGVGTAVLQCSEICKAVTQV